MKKNIFLLLLIVLSFTAGALPVDSERAILAAKNFVMQRTGATQVSATVVYTHYMPQSGLPSMYAVNINYGSGAARTSGNGGRGFVLIAADDVAYPVLGYNFGSQWPTTAGAKAGGSIEPLCAQLTDYLDDLSTQIEGASHTIGSTVEWQQLASPNAPLLAAAIDSVGPLIETQWSQGQYYNAMCPANTSGPDGHALTGCVATAMAQIVRYWEYPVHGRGTHSFSDNSNGTEGTFSADFENATYDYAHMPIRLSSTNSATEVNAVAQLMYHCGVACDMKYGASASGSYDIVARAGLVNYFRYSPDISFVEKARVTAAQWDSILHAHIGANQPVMFCGQGNYGGHAFICDGYKTDGYYHFNFGWSGSADGWYLTSAVNPSIYTFNTNQSILTGIVPYNNGNVILANRRGASTFTVGTEPLEFYHTRGHDGYRANCYTNDCSNTVLFTSTDASKQLVLDINAAEGQNLSVYDGEGGSQLTTISDGSISGSSQVISSDHTLYLDYNGSFLCNGFKVTIGQNIESTRTVTVLSNNSEMGSVTGGGVHALGGTATLTATPNCGYRFVRWMSNGETVSTNPTFNITVTQDTSFTAVFDEMTASTGIELVCSTGQTLVYDLNCPDNSATLTGYSGSCSGALAIPDTITVEGNKYPVTRIGEDAFSNCHYITSLTLGNNVTTIERQAFIYCSRLTSLYIPTSVTSIGSFVFFGCSDLESIIVSPDNPIYDSRNNCNALIETSSDWLIAGCQNTIIPEDVVGLGYGSFIYSKLRSIVIPNSVTYVERYTFAGCDSLTSIVVAPGNPVFDSRNNCNAIIQTSTNKLVAGCKTTVIPDDIAVIGQTAFYNCHLLPSITLPATLTSIEQRAIYSCSSLTRIVIPESVTEIGEYAFFNCRNLKSINIPAGVTYIDNKTFYDCLSLDSVFLASTTPPALHDTAFNTHPTFYISCGSTATYQSAWGMDYTFSEAGLIYNVTHIAPSGQTLTYILDCGNHTATLQGYNSCNGSLVIPNEITHNGDIYVVRSIADSLFYGCSGLTALVIPDSLTHIGTAAFHNCENLQQVTYNAVNCTLADSAFEVSPFGDNSHITSVQIGEGVNTIPAWLFGHHSGIVGDLVIPEGVTYIGKDAFSYAAISSVTLPQTVKYIGWGAFYYCWNLTSVTIPDVVDTVMNYSFSYNYGLRKVSFGSSVDYIGNMAFGLCSYIDTIISSNPIPPSAEGAFNGVSDETVVMVPCASVATYQNATDWSRFSNIRCESTPQRFRVTVTSYSSYGTVEGGGEYNEGETATITVTPNCGYRFIYWRNDNFETVSTESTFSFIVTSSISLTAIYSDCIPITAPSGQTLFYRLDCENHTAEVICEDYSTPRYTTFPAGDLTIPASVDYLGVTYTITGISSYAFSECTDLTSVSIPNTVTSIGQGAFYSCSGLPSIMIPNSVTRISDYLFSECNNLTSVTLPETITSIGESAFTGCGFTSITLPNTISFIGENAFSSCTSLTSITIPDSVNIIKAWTFANCSNLTSVTIPNTVTHIGDSAFAGCSRLVSLTIPRSVASIGAYGFAGCSGLTEITSLAVAAPIVDTSVFSEVESSIPVYIPCRSLRAYENRWSHFEDFIEPTNCPTPPEAPNVYTLTSRERTFIPDGPQCIGVTGENYYEGALEVTAFAPSSKIQCAEIVRSVCVEMEHSFMGDVTVSLICPNGSEAVLFYGNYSGVNREECGGRTNAGCHGGGMFLGYPLDAPYDGSNRCDSLDNPFGMGLEYCFSRSGENMLVTGDYADALEGRPRGPWYITAHYKMDAYHVTFPPIPWYFTRGGEVPTQYTLGQTTHPSNREERKDYYLPYSDFTEFEGCPMNGVWKIRVRDSWGADNGWLFGWSMDIAAMEVNAVSSNNDAGTANGGGLFTMGDTATLTATPNYGYLFSRWSDGSTDNPRSLVVTQDTTLTAIFVPYYAVVPSPYPYLEIKNKYNEYHQWIGDTLTLTAGEALTLNAEGQIPVKYFNGTYRVEEIPYAPTDTSFWLNGEGSMMPITMDDQFTSAMPIPAGFSFYFFGIKKNELRIGDNGMMTFTSDFGMDHPARADECPYSFNAAIPWNESNTPGSSGNCFHRMHDAVYGFYEDLYTSSMNMGGEYATLYPHCGVWYGIVDSWPQRKIMASWKSVPIFNNANVRETFQIVAYEGTNIIEIHVKERNGGTSTNGGRGVLGIQNATGQPQVQGDVGSSTSHVVAGSPAAFWPAGLNNTTASVTNRSFRFTPEGVVAPYTVTWKRVLEDGRVVVVNGTDGSDTNGYAVPSTDDKYFDLQATPQSTSKYICEVKYQDADNWWYTLSDTIVVKVEREEEDNLHRVTAKTYPAGDPNIRVTGLNATGMYEDGASVTLYADNSGNENYVFVAWMSGRVLLGNQPTLTLSPIVSDTMVTAYFMVEEHPELIDYLIYDDEMLKRKVIGVKEAYRNRITTAVIPRTVTAIGDGAFRGCTAMTHLTIPAGVAQLGNYVFDGCTALTEVEMHEGLTLGNYLFNNCTSLETVELPTGLTTIPEGLFYGCTALREVVLPTGVTDIGAYAYYGCSRVYTLNLPATVQRVGAQAFASMTSLHFVTLAAGLQELGNDCFRNSLNIVKTDFLGTLTDWLAISFGNANSQPVARSRNLWLSGRMLTRIEVPAGINAIKPYAFFNDTLITHITLPAGITSIGNVAFGRLTHLERIVLEGMPSGVHSGSFQSVNRERVIVEVPCRYYREGMTWEGFTHVVSKGMPILTLQQRPGGKVMFLDQPNCDAAEYSYTITAIHGVNNTFTSWSDGNTDNPRTLVLTEDMTLSPIWGRNPNATSVNVMFFDFENPQDEASWTSENESANRWVVGEAAHFNRSGKGLYVSNDNGLHNHYDPSSSPYTYSEFLFDTGYYRFTYNYMVGGNEGDFMSAGLFYEDGSYAMLTPHGEGGIMISDSLYGLDPDLDPWGYQERIIHIDSGGWYRLAFFWTANEDNEVNNPGGAVDNVMITHEDYRTLRSRVAMVYVSSNDETMGYAYTGSTLRDSVNQTSFNYYFWDDVIEIHAHSHEGYRFVRWSDGNTNAHRSLRFLDIAGVAAHFTAYFEAIPDHYTVTVDIENGATEGSLQFGVEINGEMRHYAEVTNHEPAVVKLNLPQAGWTFLGWWNGNDTLHQNPYTYMGGQNIHLTALMKEWQSCNGNGEGDNYDFGSRIPRREGFEYQFSLTDDAVVTNVKVFDRNGQIIVDHAPGFKVTVYDVNGRIIDTKKGKEEPLVFDVVVSGSYMVKIGDLMTTKVVVIK